MNHRSTTAEVKQQIQDEVERQRPSLTELSLKIHSHPEVGFQEVQASAWLSRYLQEGGFAVEAGVGELPTAFRASYGRGKPAIALIAEYDALPGIGHACGHNLIAAAATGGGIAAKVAVDAFGGSVCVLGTPAEELGAGKVAMLEKGVFQGVDIAMMVHPEAIDAINVQMAALELLLVEFFGKEAHAGVSPDEGINALEALIQSFNAINSLRPRLKHQGSIQGIITDGGKAANIIPAHSAGTFVVRAENDRSLEEIKGERC